MNQPATAYLRRPDLKAIEMDGELVMMGMEQGEYFGMRGVAASIWDHLAEARTVDELCDLVAAEYEVDVPTCRPDVEAFVDQLVAKQLIRCCEDPPRSR